MRNKEISNADKLGLLLGWDEILGFGFKEYLQSGKWQAEQDSALNLSKLEYNIRQIAEERESLRRVGEFSRADVLRSRLHNAGFKVRDTASGPLVLAVRPEEEFKPISTTAAAPDFRKEPDRYEFSINLLAQNSRADLERCVNSIVQHSYGRKLELVIIDNGSTDDTADYLRRLAKSGTAQNHECDLAVQVIFADHNLGFAAGRNATIKASRGQYIVVMDTSIEIKGDIWSELNEILNNPAVGITGPYGLVTRDLREFEESAGPEVDAIEGYMLAFRRELWQEVGPIDEKFRFYRLMDIYLSFYFKAAGYQAIASSEIASRIIKHPHREWYSLSEEEQRTKSKKNYDLFRARWHHGQSLLVANYNPADHWFGHDHSGHLNGKHTHTPAELPPPGVSHTHKHQHWPDHDHDHSHYHNEEGSEALKTKASLQESS
jgi:cysteinyl-tRNA synthetase